MTDVNDVRDAVVSSFPRAMSAAPIIKREDAETSLDTWIDVDLLDLEVTHCATHGISATYNVSISPTQRPKAEDTDACDSVSESNRAAGHAIELPSSVDQVLTTADWEALLAVCSPEMFTPQRDMQSTAQAVIQHLVNRSENAVPPPVPSPSTTLIEMPTKSRPVKPCDTQRLQYIIGGKVVIPADFPDAEPKLREVFGIPFPEPLSFDSIPDAAHLFRNQECSDRPPYNNAELAALAIFTHERRMATLSEIREIVIRRYPSLKETSFKDSLRHLLSFDASFVKIPRTESNGGPRGGGDYWALNIEMWGTKKRPKLRKRAPQKPKPELCSRPPKSRSTKSWKADSLLKHEETSIRSSVVDQFLVESKLEPSPRKRRRTERIKVEDTTGFDSSPVWLHNPWEPAGPSNPAPSPTVAMSMDIVPTTPPPQPLTVWSLPSPPTEMYVEDVGSSSPVLANDHCSSELVSMDQETSTTPLSTERPLASAMKLPLTPPHTPDAPINTSSTFGRAVLSLAQSSATRTAKKRPSRALESLLVLPPSTTSAPVVFAAGYPGGAEEFSGLLGPSLFPYSPSAAPGPKNACATEEGPSGSPISKASDDTRTETRSVSLKRMRDTELRSSLTPESSDFVTHVTRSTTERPANVERTISKKKPTGNQSDTRPSREADQVAVAVRRSLREKKQRVRKW